MQVDRPGDFQTKPVPARVPAWCTCKCVIHEATPGIELSATALAKSLVPPQTGCCGVGATMADSGALTQEVHPSPGVHFYFGHEAFEHSGSLPLRWCSCTSLVGAEKSVGLTGQVQNVWRIPYEVTHPKLPSTSLEIAKVESVGTRLSAQAAADSAFPPGLLDRFGLKPLLLQSHRRVAVRQQQF